MRINALKLIACLWILMLPISLITVLVVNTTPDQKNFSIIGGILFCLAGAIILASKVSWMVKKDKLIKGFWITVLILSALILFILMMPNLEVYFGIDMPFVVINHEQFTCFGYNIPNDKQLGFMMLTGILMMLPARILYLAILKLSNNSQKK